VSLGFFLAEQKDRHVGMCAAIASFLDTHRDTLERVELIIESVGCSPVVMSAVSRLRVQHLSLVTQFSEEGLSFLGSLPLSLNSLWIATVIIGVCPALLPSLEKMLIRHGDTEMTDFALCLCPNPPEGWFRILFLVMFIDFVLFLCRAAVLRSVGGCFGANETPAILLFLWRRVVSC
jgi:hypothetical protein